MPGAPYTQTIVMRLFTTDDLFSLSNINLDKWTNTVAFVDWHDLAV